jgi:phosphoglycolate phosphatase
LALFDCDGTLVDSQLAVVAAMTAALQAAGLAAPDPQTVRRVVNLPATEAIALLLPGSDPWFVKRLAGLYRDAYYGGQTPLHRTPEQFYPGIREALNTLRDHGLLLGIATGKSWRGLAAVLDQHGMTDWFVTLQTADRARGKPDPEMVCRALAESGARAADTVVIGDTTADIEMALAGGVRPIGVSWGLHDSRDLQAAGARRVVHDTTELVAAVLDLLDRDHSSPQNDRDDKP